MLRSGNDSKQLLDRKTVERETAKINVFSMPPKIDESPIRGFSSFGISISEKSDTPTNRFFSCPDSFKKRPKKPLSWAQFGDAHRYCHSDAN